MTPYQMRVPCFIETRNGQDCVFCDGCKRLCYNAPKTETGRASRSVTTVHNGIAPSKRARILERDNGRCVLCGRKENLHAGHLLSVAAGLKQGLTEVELNADENLAAMCDECNLGLGERPVPIRLMMAVLIARLKIDDDKRS